MNLKFRNFLTLYTTTLLLMGCIGKSNPLNNYESKTPTTNNIKTTDNTDKKSIQNYGNGNTYLPYSEPYKQRPSTTSNTPTTSSTSPVGGDKNMVFIQGTTHCVQYRNLRNSNGMQWYELNNRCAIQISIWKDPRSDGAYGELEYLAAGSRSESWFSAKYGRISYTSCPRQGPAGEDVHLDKKTLACFYRRK